MILLDGNKIKQEQLGIIKEEIKKYLLKPCLAVIQIGDDEASNTYVRMKEKTAQEIGVYFKHIKYNENVREREVINKIKELNNDEYVDGILVQLPIPSNLDVNKIINHIAYSKDVDGLNDTSGGRLFHQKKTNIPCTPKGIIDLLDYYNIPIEGKHVVILGRSNLVGRPLGELFLNRNATVTMCHSKTLDVEKYTKDADIIVCAIGKKEFLKKDMVKDGVVVVDVGINRLDGKLYGDVCFDEVSKKALAITKVPGGVGPMTILNLFKNVLDSYKNRITSK